MIWGWGVAQFPYLLPTELTIAAGAGTGATLTMVIIVFVAAAVLVLPRSGCCTRSPSAGCSKPT